MRIQRSVARSCSLVITLVVFDVFLKAPALGLCDYENLSVY